MRIRTALTGAAVVAVTVVLLHVSGMVGALDRTLLDIQFSLLRTWHPRPVTNDVVVVGIDEQTLQQLPEPVALWHRHLGRFLHAMAAAQPAAVGLDVVLPDRSHDAVAPGADTALLRGMLDVRRVSPLLLALTVDPGGATRPIHRPFLAAAGAEAAGYALLQVDPDGVVRRFDERLGDKGEAVATLTGQMARRLGVTPGSGLIDYSRGDRFTYIPLQQVLAWAEAQNVAELQRAFRGKPVLLGMVLPFDDRQRLPVTLAAWEEGTATTPGVLLQAQVLRSLLSDGLIATLNPLGVTALAAAAALLWLVAARLLIVLLVGAAFAGAMLVLSAALLAAGTHLPLATVVLTGLLALGARNAWEALLLLKERRRLRNAFAGYVSPSVMDDILAGQIQPELGGVRRNVCILFSDIRGYTTRSESMTPEAIVDFLNRYFEEAVALIHARGGTVVCFMGDGIMAMFGAPNTLENSSQAAFEAGCDMLRYVGEFNQRMAPGEQPVEIGVGLHAGEAVVGHVGSSTRHDYTAIGDVTNVASRLEGLTKEAGFRLVCSTTVAERLAQRSVLTHLGPMAIKGHTPVDVYGYDRV